MLFESLEARQLMAGVGEVTQYGPLTGSSGLYTQSIVDYLHADRVDQAFQRVSDLSRYSTADLRSADQWVIQLLPAMNVNHLAQALGVTALTPEPLIHDTYIYTVPASFNRLEVGKFLQTTPGVKYAYPLVAHDMQPRFVPNDPLFNQQWHLSNTGQTGGLAGADANVTGAWDLATGAGVVIAVVDDGVQHTHPDLNDKYLANLSIDLVDGDNDPAPDITGDFHGTSVAGVAAGETNNNLGIAGAAPGAGIAGIRLLGGNQDDSTEAAALSFQNQAIDIYNNSWGPPDGYGTYTAIGPLALAALQQAVGTGRGGLGSIMVWAGGNGRQGDDNSNYDGYANLPFTFAVAAIDANGRQSAYSESGSNILISAPSSGGGTSAGIVTTDLLGSEGYNYAPGAALDDDPLVDLNYTSTFGGTSSAAPLVAGVIALVLEANPNLTWRDVRQILIQSATKNDPSDAGWTINGAGYAVNEKYGFGAINATAAVNLARNWTLLPAEIGATITPVTANLQIPDNNVNGVVGTVAITNAMRIESMDVLVDITHAYPGDLEIVLISPAGTRSVLSEARIANPFAPDDGLQGWYFNTKRVYGENTLGTWTLEIRDLISGDVGTVNGFRFDFYGTDIASGTPTGILNGTVWNDADSDGVRDVTESGLAGITVFLDTNGNGVADGAERTTTSLSDGSYVFNNLPAGTYLVDTVIPPGATATFPAAGASQTVAVVVNQAVSNVNFGVLPAPVNDTPHFLSNMPGDGTVRVGVDGFGAFGSFAGNATDAYFDPPGGVNTAGTTFESGVLFGTGGGRVMLASDAGGSTLVNPLIAGDQSAANSSFSFQGLNFTLTQTLEPLFDRSGNRIGSQLVQTYAISNPGSTTIDFDMVRYLDGDLDFDGSLIDGGGRLLVGGTEILFETDSATGSTTSTAFVGISASGGQINSTNRYEVSSYRQLLARLLSGDSLTSLIEGDGGDADEFIDAGAGYDVTLALQNNFSLAAGGSATYSTITYFGNSAPQEILPPPPPPAQVGGVVINDRNGDGVQNPGEPGIPGVVVYLDLNNDGKIGLGEPAQTTNSLGQYGFTVPAGTYTLRQGYMAGWSSTAPLNGVYTVQAGAGDLITNLLFGNYSHVDWGDAPATFPTMASQGGASHSTLAGMYLGSGVDGEADGQPSLLANGDDIGINDDDGVQFTSLLIPGQTATVNVTVHNGPRASGVLNGWIDFNGDGDWSDAGEQVFNSLRMTEGVNYLSIAVPSWASPNYVYARFRYGYGQNISYAGNVLGGEVEDYRLTITGLKPTARPDEFTVQKNSSGNVLDVLFNDVASPLGANQFIGGSYTGSLGGKATVDTVNRKLLYTPKADTFGIETFNYTISDYRGGVATTTVTVNIVQTAEPPRAVDDSFAIATGAPSTDFDVYANDALGTGAFVSLKAPTASVGGGSVVVVQPGNLLRYTPPAGFTGLDRVIYTIRDSNGLESSATMTLHVGNDSADDVLAIDLIVTDASGIALSEVVVGQSFQVRAYVRDLRVGQPIPGVEAAYLDLLYSQSLVAVNKLAGGLGFDVTFGSEFSIFRSGSSAVSGLIDEIGGARDLAPAIAGSTELFRINFTALALGTAAFTADPADLAVAHDVMFVDPAIALPISRITFDTATVDVVATPTLRFRNQNNSRDVDGDGHVSPVDAVMIINELNTNGILSVAGRSPSLLKPMYWDVSGDNQVTPYDALLIINYLNVGGAGEAPANAVVTELAGVTEPAIASNSPVAIESNAGLLPYSAAAPDSLIDEASMGELAFHSPSAPATYFWLPSGTAGNPASGDESDAEQSLDDLFDLLASDIDEIWQA